MPRCFMLVRGVILAFIKFQLDRLKFGDITLNFLWSVPDIFLVVSSFPIWGNVSSMFYANKHQELCTLEIMHHGP